VDLTLAEGHGLELIKDLAVLESPPPTLVVSGHEEDLYAERCLTAGAHGYVRKTCGMAGLLEAARRVMAGMVHVSPELMQRMLNQRRAKSSPGSPLGLLSDREMQVLEGIGRGRSTKEIAASLGVDAATIDSHRGRLREKLGLSGMHALAVYAFQWVHLGVMSATPGKTTAPTGAESARPGIGVVQGKNAGSVG
jgi:DNA-binding NarL/FixJ family response regulator